MKLRYKLTKFTYCFKRQHYINVGKYITWSCCIQKKSSLQKRKAVLQRWSNLHSSFRARTQVTTVCSRLFVPIFPPTLSCLSYWEWLSDRSATTLLNQLLGIRFTVNIPRLSVQFIALFHIECTSSHTIKQFALSCFPDIDLISVWVI